MGEKREYFSTLFPLSLQKEREGPVSITGLLMSLEKGVVILYHPQVRGGTSWEKSHLTERWVNRIAWGVGGVTSSS